MGRLEAHKRVISTYSKQKMLLIVREICEIYSTGHYTLESVCENAGVPYRTFKHWWTKYEQEGSIDGSRWSVLAEVAGQWSRSQEKRQENGRRELVERAEQMLMKRITGYVYEITETVYKSSKDDFGNTVFTPSGIKKKTKHVHPSDYLIKFVLTRLCPEKYGDWDIVAIPPAVLDKYQNLSLEELNAEIKILEAQLRLEP
jgi:hypothetical protein